MYGEGILLSSSWLTSFYLLSYPRPTPLLYCLSARKVGEVERGDSEEGGRGGEEGGWGRVSPYPNVCVVPREG